MQNTTSQQSPALLVVRPYGDWIRDHIFDILRRAGLDTEPTHVVPEDADDQAVVEAWRRLRPRALLVPYHAKRDPGATDGFRSGISALDGIRAHSSGRLGIPAVMPVSEFGKLGFEGMLKRRPPDFHAWFERNVCLLSGPFDDHEAHAATVAAHLTAA